MNLSIPDAEDKLKKLCKSEGEVLSLLDIGVGCTVA